MIPAEFHFLRPLWLLALVPVVLLLVLAFRRKSHGSAWRSVVDEHLLRHLVVQDARGLSRWPLHVLALAWLATVVAMAGPSWEKTTIPGERGGQATVLALDMSISMDAADTAPSRLARARFELADILKRSRDGQTGLVLYAEEPFIAAPLTDDIRVIEELVPLLKTDLMPGVGSRADRAIDEASLLLDRSEVGGGRIVLLSDGSDLSADAIAAAGRARSAGHEVSVLGFGTEEGATVTNTRGREVRLTNGEPFIARRDTAGLEAIAAAGGGYYANATADGRDLDHILRESVFTGTTTSSIGELEIWKDEGIWFVFVPLALAPLAFRRGWLLALLVVLGLGTPRPAHAGLWEDIWATRDQQAAAAFADGRPEDAASLFEDSEWQAASLYESGDYEEAESRYAALRGTENLYNHGNALARTGDLDAAIEAYEEVIASVPDHEDAIFNRDLLRQLQQQQEQQQDQQSSDQQQGGQDDQDSQDGDQQQADGEEGSDSEQASGEQGGEQDSRDQQASDDASGQEEQGEEQRAENAGAEDEQHAEDDLREQVEQALREQQEAGEEEAEEAKSRMQQLAERNAEITEEEQAREQILRQIPQDPAGLLRAKIHQRYAERRYAEGR